MTPASRRRWFQISLRALIALLILGTLAVSWITLRMRRAKLQRQLVARVSDYGIVRYDWEEVAPEMRRWAPADSQTSSALDTRSHGWFRRWLGPEYFQRVTDVNLSRSAVSSQIIPVVGSDSPTADDRGMAGSYEISYALGEDPEADALDSILRVAGKVRSIRRLYLARCQVDDRMLARISRLRDLEELDLQSTHVLGEGLHHLSRMKKLKWLSLRDTELTDSALLALRELSGLEHLDLSGTRIRGRRLGYLKGLTRLKSLKLDQLELGGDDEGADIELSQLVSLEHLSCRDWRITGVLDIDDLHIEALQRLRVLDLTGVERLPDLSGLSRLEKLTLDDSAVTDDDLRSLIQIKTLRELHLARTRVSIAGARHLLAAGRLERVWLEGSKVTKQAMLELRHDTPTGDFSRFGRGVLLDKSATIGFKPLISPQDRLPPGWTRPPDPSTADPFK